MYDKELIEHLISFIEFFWNCRKGEGVRILASEWSKYAK